MDRWLGSLLTIGALVLYFLVAPAQVAMPKVRLGSQEGAFALSPLFFPRLVAVGVGLLGGLLFFRGRSRPDTLRAGEGFRLPRQDAARVGGTLALLVLYLAGLDTLGYLLATPLALVALKVFLGARRWVVIGAVAVVTTVAIYLGFQKGMSIILPEGTLF